MVFKELTELEWVTGTRTERTHTHTHRYLHMRLWVEWKELIVAALFFSSYKPVSFTEGKLLAARPPWGVFNMCYGCVWRPVPCASQF